MEPDLIIEDLAVIKMILHAAKHPECSVNGILLRTPKDDSKLVITDYIPLFHTAITLAPMLETAFYQIDSYCVQKNLGICGYFQANEHVHFNSPSAIAIKIADKIAEKCGTACLLILKNDQFHNRTGSCFSAYIHKDSKWNETKYSVGSKVNSRVKEVLESKEHHQLMDFDDHLNYVNCDFLNLKLSNDLMTT